MWGRGRGTHVGAACDPPQGVGGRAGVAGGGLQCRWGLRAFREEGGARSPWGKEPHSGPRSRGVQGPPAPREQLEEAGEERTLGSWPGHPEDLSPGVAGSRGEGRTGGSLPHGMRGPGLQDVGGSGHTLRRAANRLPSHPLTSSLHGRRLLWHGPASWGVLLPCGLSGQAPCRPREQPCGLASRT